MFGWTAKGMMFRHSQGQRLLAPVPKKLQLTVLAASIRASIRNKDTLVAAAGLRFYRIPLANRPTGQQDFWACHTLTALIATHLGLR